jgi:hypothetical protein
MSRGDDPIDLAIARKIAHTPRGRALNRLLLESLREHRDNARADLVNARVMVANAREHLAKAEAHLSATDQRTTRLESLHDELEGIVRESSEGGFLA